MTGEFVENPTWELVADLWDKVPHGDSIWNALVGKTYQQFASTIFESRAIIVYPFGFLRLGSFVPGGSMAAHGVFWGKEVTSAKDIIQADAAEVGKLYGIGWISVMIPAECRGLERLLKKWGFKLWMEKPKTYDMGYALLDALVYTYDCRGGTNGCR